MFVSSALHRSLGFAWFGSLVWVRHVWLQGRGSGSGSLCGVAVPHTMSFTSSCVGVDVNGVAFGFRIGSLGEVLKLWIWFNKASAVTCSAETSVSVSGVVVWFGCLIESSLGCCLFGDEYGVFR